MARGAGLGRTSCVALGLGLGVLLAASCGERKKAVEHNNRGYSMLSQKRLAEAAAAFEAAIAADPSLAEPYLGLGRVYDETQRLDKAEAALRKYTQLRKEDADGHYYLAVVLEQLKRFGDAVKSFRAAGSAIPPTPRTHLAHFRMGRIHAKQGEPNEAADAFRAAIKANPTFLRAYEELANTYADHGDLASAEQALQNAIATRIPDAHVHASLGLVYSMMADRVRDEDARNKELERAAEQFQIATKIKPSYARAYWNLGMTLAKVMKDGKPSRRKDALRNLELFRARHGKDDSLMTQANDMIHHLAE
jgi:tetratricopeptide (TPR) repeat protein